MATDISSIIRSYAEIGISLSREPQPLSFGTFEECKSLFESAFKAADRTISNFKMLQEYNGIITWMTNTEGKGLLLSGPCGVGKSIIIKSVIPIIFNYRFNKLVYPYNAIEMPMRYAEIAKKPFVCIDDVGCEPLMNDYGTKKEAFSEIVSCCENELKPLFISTNLTGKEISERYDDRVRSRLNRLCKCIVFPKNTKDMRVS